MRARLLLVAAGICACSAVATPAQPPSIVTFFARLREGNDVTWLERVASSESGLTAAWLELGNSGRPSSALRGEAYARLGAVGTDASLAAIHLSRPRPPGSERSQVIFQPRSLGPIRPRG